MRDQFLAAVIYFTNVASYVSYSPRIIFQAYWKRLYFETRIDSVNKKLLKFWDHELSDSWYTVVGLVTVSTVSGAK